MSDMYGAVCSNVFKVKDVNAFKTWFNENVSFGSEIELWGDDEGVSFGGYEQYPNAYPMTVPTEDEYDDFQDPEEWDLEAFAVEIRKHLLPEQELRVLAAGHEKLRYVAVGHLVIGHNKATFDHLYEGN